MTAMDAQASDMETEAIDAGDSMAREYYDDDDVECRVGIESA
jgi:hypothetical protein